MHPLLETSAPVLQYADDTILLIRADQNSVLHLKMTLDSFSACTGLVINYSKSTTTPLHIDDGNLQSFISLLGCSMGQFPQTYLGLPLSNVKLPLSAFAPLIARVDRYLATWKAVLQTKAGRVVLINAVLGGLLNYMMGALLLPRGVVDAIDKRHRAFLWTGSDKASDAHCLIAWEDVCKDKEDDGLGIINITTQNACLLLKLLHCLHRPAGSAWAT